jgi:hypothetical protein
VSVICCAVSLTSNFKLHSIDDTIDEIRIDVENPNELFGSVLEVARGGIITVDSAPQFIYFEQFALLCGIHDFINRFAVN